MPTNLGLYIPAYATTRDLGFEAAGFPSRPPVYFSQLPHHRHDIVLLLPSCHHEEVIDTLSTVPASYGPAEQGVPPSWTAD